MESISGSDFLKASEIHLRRKKISDLLYEQKEVKVKELVALFEVSDETIRTDLAILEKQGILQKVYGGAVLIDQDKLDPVLERSSVDYQKKMAIVQAALKHVPSVSCSIGLDQGSTVAMLAHGLKKYDNKTIFTASLASILELMKSKNTLYCFGGKFSYEDLAFQGDFRSELYANIQLDFCFFGSSGVKGRAGFCTSSFTDAELKRNLLKRSTKKIVLLDSSKFQQSSLIEVATWRDVDLVITNKDIPELEAKKIRNETHLITV